MSLRRRFLPVIHLAADVAVWTLALVLATWLRYEFTLEFVSRRNQVGLVRLLNSSMAEHPANRLCLRRIVPTEPRIEGSEVWGMPRAFA